MRIGIISDSHGHNDPVRGALAIFAAHEVDAVVHCGDVGGSKCIELLAGGGANVYVVAGNMDRRVDRLATVCQKHGVLFSSEVVEVPIGDGKFLVATHGDDERLLGELIAEQQFPYICHGHTHNLRDERINGVRVINPGALHHAKLHTVAVLDTETDMLEHILVP